MNSDMDRTPTTCAQRLRVQSASAGCVGVTDGDMIASVKNGNAVALVQNV